MKYALAFALVCLVAMSAAPAYAQEAPKPDAKPATVDVNGVWDMVVEAPQGPVDVVTTFKQEGEKITGTQASPMGEIAIEGTVVGNENQVDPQPRHGRPADVDRLRRQGRG